jgi:NAD(P)H-dependent flavin oxidoreductase YrpB (nitropropane dioxygenase family)/REP element-mobilizing transposase RayT
MSQSFNHTFHIPVMGIGFTIDTPAKVAHYGISSAISLVDDTLVEKMREFYSKKFDIPYQSISEKIEDFRAKRITAYLNVIEEVVKRNFEELKNSISKEKNELEKYLEMLPNTSELKKKFYEKTEHMHFKDAMQWVKDKINPGSIDVNIMTKLDKDNYIKNEKLPVEFNDAHAALRGFAQSNLKSSIILSAGMNPRLYNYIENFDDFYPKEDNTLTKKIILKVSDYRSALIQGKYLAKKGIHVSEYRVESGLNCGGHAFGTDGYLLGAILEEFKANRQELKETTYALLKNALQTKKRYVPNEPLPIKLTAQGGVGTAEEHQFLIDYYQVDSVGWGTPFLLVPEAANVDPYTQQLLSDAKEEDLYLSGISPLGIQFNSLTGNTQDVEKQQFIDQGRPGSACTKKYAVLNKEYTDKAICTASRQYQRLKIKELQEQNLAPEVYKEQYNKVVEKACLCVGLSVSALIVNNLDHKIEGNGVSVCPGPNMAYFSEVVSLKKMVDHIYGRVNVIKRTDRPHMFIKELTMYIDFLKRKVQELTHPVADKQLDYLHTFKKNVDSGIEYYKSLFIQLKAKYSEKVLMDLDDLRETLNSININEIKEKIQHQAELQLKWA